MTLDVSSLYTNIPNDLGIQACREPLEVYRSGAKNPSNSSIIEFLEMVLTMNNFDFNGLHSLQVGGTAMGTRLDITSNNWDMLDNSSSTRPLLHIPVIRGFRRPQNLRDLLVRAKLTTQDDRQDKRHITSKRDKCQRFKCNYCKVMNKEGKIICPFNKRTYVTRYNVSCSSNNLIYCLYCKACSKIYVGQTKRSTRERIGEHFTSIRKCKKHLVVGRHYNSACHDGVSNVKIYVLDFISTPPATDKSKKLRELIELKWIFGLRSLVPLGLNLAD